MTRIAPKRVRKSVHFWVLATIIALVFLAGGGSRADIQSLIILRPVAILVCCFALFTIRREHLAEYRFLFGIAASAFLLVALHLIPLPPSIWTALPGRGLILEIDQATGLGEVWRPISMAPLTTWNALYSLSVPFAVLLLAVQLDREEQFALLPYLIGLGLISGLLGLLQAVGAREGPLYFYRITNYGSAVGLFANRNHQAALLACLFPLLATYASIGARTIEQARFRAAIAIVAGVVLVPLLLVTGSRAGIAVGLIGLLSVPLLYRKPEPEVPPRRRVRSRIPFLVMGGLGVIGLALLTALFARAEAFNRLLAPDTLEGVRFKAWGPIVEMTLRYLPFGSGVGSFAEIYKIHEPDFLLKSTYLNHAHNDWLEIVMTGGIPAALIAALAAGGWARCSLRVWRSSRSAVRETLFGRLGSVLLLMLGIASIGDYPLRTPSIACFAVISATWLAAACSQQLRARSRSSAKTGGTMPNSQLADRSGA